MVRLIFENIAMAVIGLVTGAFVGGFVFGGGMSGAIITGIVGAFLFVLPSILFHLINWTTVERKLKYFFIGILPGVLLGGGMVLGFGVKGAVIFGIINALFFAAIIDKGIESLKRKERYYQYAAHTFVVFLFSAAAVFITLIVTPGVLGFVDFEKVLFNMSFWPVFFTGLVLLVAIYFIQLAIMKKRKGSWQEAFTASRWSVWLTVSAVLLASLILTRFEGTLEIMITAVAGFVIPFAISLIIPFSIGYLMAANTNRPVMGAVITLIGSVFVLIVGISVAPMLLLPGSGLMWAGLITGLFMVLLGILSLVKPDSGLFIGGGIIVFSILSFIGAAGGLIIGGILGLLGGTLVAAWGDTDSKITDDGLDVSRGQEEIASASSNTI